MGDETPALRTEGSGRPANPPATAGSAPAWAGLTPESDLFALQLRATAGAVFLDVSLGRNFPLREYSAFQTYRDCLVADCGNPTEAIAVMMSEQIALAPERVRAAALVHQPWRFSTGSRAPEGKATVAANGKAFQQGETFFRGIRAERAGNRPIWPDR
jgi:hypothetical protein